MKQTKKECNEIWNRRANGGFKIGIIPAAGLVLSVMLFTFVLSNAGIVTGHQEHGKAYNKNNAYKYAYENNAYPDNAYKMMRGQGCSAMHGSMNEMASMDAEEMDENGDGLCDMCGMPAEQCKGMKGAGGQEMHSSEGQMHGTGGHMEHGTGCSAMHGSATHTMHKGIQKDKEVKK